ncbi:MAG: carboxymuconolactone decarboxylase family protein [Ignavibacteria bacterium]
MSITETKNDLLKDLKLDETVRLFTPLEAMTAGDTRYLRDLRINLKNTLASENLSIKEACLIALAVSANEKNEVLAASFTSSAKENGATDAEIAEIYACASMLSVNNVLYRFRHFVKNETYTNMPAGIKMNIMMNPVLGKEFFELVSLCVSALNGCENCVGSHEASVRKLGSPEVRIFDAIRLTSVVKGLSAVIH